MQICSGRSLRFFALVSLTTALLACDKADVSIESLRLTQERGDYAKTLQPLQERIEDGNTDAETYFLYGRALIGTQQPELAYFALNAAMDDPAYVEPAGLELAIAGLLSGDLHETVDATTRILDAQPEHVDALLFRAQAHAHGKTHPESALDDAAKVLELAPNRIEAYEPWILALLALERSQEASDVLAEAGRRLSEIDASSEMRAWHCSTTTLLAMDRGDPDGAATAIEGCLEKFPGMPTVVTAALRFFDSQGQHDRGLSVLRDAYQSEPNSRAYRTGLANRLRATGAPAEAEQILRAATETETPASATVAWLDLGEHYHALAQYAKAAAAVGRAVELAPIADAQLEFRHADALVLAGELDQADRAAANLTIPAHMLLIQARVAQLRGNHAIALKRFVEAAQLWPDNPWARYYAAVSAEHLGDFERAIEEYRYSIRIQTEATDARVRAANLLSKLGDAARAYQLLFFRVDELPLGSDGLVLGHRLIAQVANPSQLSDALVHHLRSDPSSYVDGLVSAAEGLRLRGDLRVAFDMLRNAPGIDYTQPAATPLLKPLVRIAHEASHTAPIDELFAASPAAAVEGRWVEAQALHAELSGRSTKEVTALYARAVALDPTEPAPHLELARLTLTSAPETSLAWAEKALAVSPENSSALVAKARALLAADRADERTIAWLARVVERDPFAEDAARTLVEIALQRDAVDARTIDFALRAARLGRSDADLKRLARVYRTLGDENRATAAEASIGRRAGDS